MSIPNLDYIPPVIAGDPHDDDAEIIDNLVESNAAPPTPAERPKAPISEPLDKPKPISRLMTGTLVVDKNWAAPTLLLPADANRKMLHITANSTTSTDVVLVADEMNKAGIASVAAQLPVWLGGVDLPGYTGPVYVFAPNAAATVTVSYMAVTS